MKLSSHFDNFLKDAVNLNQSRIDTLKSRVDTITDFVKSSDEFKEHFIEANPQGSWAHKTIIKPSEKSPSFDADVVVYLKEVNGWEPKDYVGNLYKIFRGNGTYRDLVHRNTRCVVIDYMGEFHIDMVPCVRKEVFIGLFEDEECVCNRLTNEEEHTAPQRYTDWFIEKDKDVSNHRLIKAVRLAKYMRDIKGNFSVKSILLTTLLANQVGGWENYPDLPTALKKIFNALNDFLQTNETMPIVKNPVLASEDFNRHWDQTKYSNFREKVRFYTEKINAAFDEPKRLKSIRKWREVFGDEFAKSVNVEAKSINEELISREYIPAYEKPESRGWSLAFSTLTGIAASAHESKNGPIISGLLNDGIALPPNQWLKFECLANTKGCDVYWQVVNTGKHAKDEEAFRGDIFSGRQVRWESTLYHGKHRIRYFVINKESGHCVARSSWFYVNVWNDSWED